MTQQSLDHGGFIGEERVPVRASLSDGYQCTCGGKLHLIDASETGASFLCMSGHGWIWKEAWGFDQPAHWTRSDMLYARFGSEYEAAFPDRIPA